MDSNQVVLRGVKVKTTQSVEKMNHWVISRGQRGSIKLDCVYTCIYNTWVSPVVVKTYSPIPIQSLAD